jgi:small ligand-binding sensory domain FIST
MQTSSLNFCRKDLLEFVDSIDVDPEKTIVVQEDRQNKPACAFIHSEEANMWKDARVGENLSAAKRDAVFQLFVRLWQCFPPADGNLGSTDMTEHAINTGDARPISCAPYRVSAAEERIITEKIAEMLKQGIIRPSFSPWAALVVIVKKKSGDYRFCVDY